MSMMVRRLKPGAKNSFMSPRWRKNPAIYAITTSSQEVVYYTKLKVADALGLKTRYSKGRYGSLIGIFITR